MNAFNSIPVQHPAVLDQPDQMFPGDRGQLTGVTVGELPQKLSQRYISGISQNLINALTHTSSPSSEQAQPSRKVS